MNSSLALLILEELKAIVKSFGSETPPISIVAFNHNSILHSSSPRDSFTLMSQSLSVEGTTGISKQPS